MKRIYKIHKRDSNSQVQQVNTITRTQIIDNLMHGKPVIDAGQFNESFDFPDGEVDFNKPRFDVFGDKIDRFLQTKQFDLEIQERVKQQQQQQILENGTDTSTEGQASDS